MFSFFKKKLKEREVERGEEPGTCGLLRVIRLVSSRPRNLDVTVFSAHIQIYNLPGKELERPNLLLGREGGGFLKGPREGRAPALKSAPRP